MNQSTSPAFSFNAIDWAKSVRFLMVMLAGAVVTYVVPWLTGFSYVFGGHDFTFVALAVLSTVAEMLRRYATDHQPA